MIPSLVTRELRDALVEYLSTTFSLTEDDTGTALREFLESGAEGIFRGPYLRLRLPFVEADPKVPSPLHWTGGIAPYAHQLAAWIRLVGRGRIPAPTLLTTGTGSGKTEGFLGPIIDHCVWARHQGQIGVKAILMYPMNALVTDQERRVAQFMADPVVAASGVRAGVWIGGDETVATLSAMTKERLITDRDVMKADPPDILLTNYKMLDRLLTSAGNSKLWAANTPPASGGSGWEQPLKYMVLDEFHSYDGAQGTDVAMLLRRLGDRLGIATPANALTGVGPVGTSATLGSAATGTGKIVEFATRVFGVKFDLASVIGEQRKTLDQVIPQRSLDFELPFPSPADVDAVTVEPLDLDGLAVVFTGGPFSGPVAMGEVMEKHRLTRTLLGVTSGPPRDWAELVAEVSDRSPWGEAFLKDPEMVSKALAKFVALLSKCKRSSGAPLFGIEMQLWVREVARLLRSVDPTPGFKWADSPADPDAGRVLPSVFCTVCGRSGWMGVANRIRPGPLIETLGDEPAGVYAASIGTKDQRSRTRTMIRANAAESGVLWLSAESGQVHPKDDGARIPVLVGGMDGPVGSEKVRDEVALRQECPSCGARDAIRFLGSRVTTLASVSITQMFGSSHVGENERRLLAFTDSVQDASHRASFFGGRTHRFNLRAVLSKQVQDAKRPLPLTDAADAVIADALTAVNPSMALFALTPPDIVREPLVVPCWETRTPPRSGVEAIRNRVRFDVAMEFGLRARLGRTIETTGTGVAAVHVDPVVWEAIVTEARAIFDAHRSTLPLQPVEIDHWVRGVIDRVRLRGGINHPWFDRYIREGGRRWPLWGGRPSLMAAFPTGISAPAFPVSAAPNDRSEFDVMTGRQSWYGNWAERNLGITGAAADNCNRDLFELLSHHQVLTKLPVPKSASVAWALPPEIVHIHDLIDGEDGETVPCELICSLCQTRHYVPAAHTGSWDGRLCLRYRCAGRYAVDTIPASNYYRRLYRKGTIRRVVATEHTGMLDDAERREVEDGFRGRSIPPGPKVTDPNVIVATPTLEMGIDIGDLSAAMLTSVPRNQASYVQRAGRAGRKTGNALITTFAEADPRSLYFLTDPTLMIAGDIDPPACYLDAPEILHRQYLAYLVDRAAAGVFDPGGKMPYWISGIAGSGRAQGGWLTAVLAHGGDMTVMDRFIGLFGSELSPLIAADLRAWAVNDLDAHVNKVLDRWADETRDLRNRLKRLRDRERELEDNPHRTTLEDEDLGRITSEAKSLARTVQSRAQRDSLGALEALGLLPNYSLFDDAVTMNANLWQQIEDPAGGKPTYRTDRFERTRPATQAIREFAPGNHFYVNAHKITVDAVEIGPDSEPHHRLWRLCPDCGFGTDSPDPVSQCPRCHTSRIVEAERQIPLLPIRAVHSTDSEIKTRTTDDSDDRDQVSFEMVTTVDFDPDDILASYKHERVVFGVEAARNVTIRYLNLGRFGPKKTKIAGHENTVSLFTVCTRCGGVLGVRADRQKPDEKGHHQGFCKVRSGALSPQWENLALSHELRTEAVRFLLPVSTFQAVERIASFQAALLTGLADSYGGDPQNLRIVTSTFPSEDGDRNHFLVLHDTVPGGTGYLHRLADPVRLRDILTAARTIISTCPCQSDGLPGCHRCLYGHTHRSQLPLVTRATALSVLDELLTDWKLSRQDGTIAGTRLDDVRQSELERKFRLLLRGWAGATSDVTLTDSPDPSQAGQVVFDLRFADGGPRWRITEQKDERVRHNTVPDFWATRADTGNTPPVAIFLDGWEHHGLNPYAVDGDAVKRASLRAAGVCVWSLMWGDVDDAHTHYNDPTRPLGHRSPLNAHQQLNSAGFSKRPGAPVAPAALDLHPFLMLMAYLRSPDPRGWQEVAEATAMGGAAQAIAAPTRTGSIHDVVVAATAHQPVPASDGPHTVFPWRTDNDVRAVTVISPGNSIAAAVTNDTTTPRPAVADDLEPWKRGWADWMHLGNMLQHLGPSRVTVTTTEVAVAAGLSGASEPTAPAAAPGAGPVDFLNCYDDATETLARAVVGAGYTNVVFGMEPGDSDGTTIEAAWPDRKVGIVVNGNAIGASLAGAGWVLKHAADWTPDALNAALEGKYVTARNRLVFAKEFLDDLMKLEPSVRQKVLELPGKFEAGSEAAGTHLERIRNAADSRVRTVRVDLFWRGVVVNLEPHLYILMRVLGEEDANKWAARHRFAVNPVTGIFEVIRIAEVNELVAAAPATRVSTLYDHRQDKDFIQLGVDPDLLPALRRLVTEEEALAISSLLPPAQAAAVLGLVDDREVEVLWADIAEQYDIDTREEIDTEDAAAAFERPGTKAEFLLTVTDDEVAAALSGDLAAWKTFLHPSQRKVAYKVTFNGPAKVTGGAGTGKTVVVIHRAKYLAGQLLRARDEQGRPDKDGRVLVATFTKALRGNLQATLREFCTPEEFRRIDVVNVDAHALQIARTAHPKLGIAPPSTLTDLAEQAVNDLGLDFAGYDGRFLLTEWEQVILARGHRTAADYLTSPRPGRGRRLTRDLRKKVWTAIEQLTDALHRQNRATYLQFAQIAADTLDARTVRPYRHVVIDESQDLHPVHWAFLRANVRGQKAQPNDMFLVGDAHQRIYDYKVNLSALSIETRGRSRRLTINYRTSHQILAWSLALLTGETFDDLDGGVDPASGYHSSFSGPVPERERFTLAVQEATWIADKVQEWLGEGVPMTIGIVTPYRNHQGPIRDALTERGITHTNVPDDTDRDTQPPAQVILSTMHSAKGLEFTRMIVAAVNDDAIPARVTPEAADPVQHAADMLRERCLLYVACTRARDHLAVTSSGTPSRLLPA